MAKVFDVIVVGAGPAGLSAATYIARAQLSVLVFKDEEDSNLQKVPFIGNMFGFPKGISGSKILQLGEQHVKKYKTQIKAEEVVRCRDLSLEAATSPLRKKFPKAKFVVTTMKGDYACNAVVIAVGMQIKSAGITNEFKFLGKGVAVCVACDGPFFKNKKVMVVGNGSLAASEAIELATYTKEIAVNTNGLKSTMDKRALAKLKKLRIPVINKKVASVDGERWVTQVTFMDNTTQALRGLFLATGTASAIDFAKSMGLLMRANALEVDKNLRTSVAGVWAAGDVTGPPRQIGKSVGEGVRAAIDIIEVARGGTYVDHRED